MEFEAEVMEFVDGEDLKTRRFRGLDLLEVAEEIRVRVRGRI